ncbi:Tannase 30 kDa subunit [Aureobasidium pullulans]|nr:Tannase 30 kDa subunit [Aureobasidium pullulans]THZ60138.1 Tannase 30 kDa subunit [Aureobasidium pullulans]
MSHLARAAVAAAAAVNASSLADVCTVSNVQAALPANGTLLGIDLIPSAVTASAVYNASTSMGGMGSSGGATYSYCNVTITYTHTGKNDEVVVKYAFPQPSDFKKRFYVAGGGGFSLSSTATGGLEYGAVGAATSAGYDAFDYSYDEVLLAGNGSINWDATYMFSYQALGEMTKVGKYITEGFYGMNNTKVYTYYEGCSDGGREGPAVNWMTIGMVRYLDSLQTTLPDLTTFRESGGKLLHYHGESDPSIPAASSVHYWQSVRSIMYGHLSQEDAQKELQDWYQFYLIPGAAHCGTNSLQPGPYPENNMNIMIDWVENGNKPSRLNATVSSGNYEGETQMLCQWPTRPVWHGNSTFDCVNDKASIDSWTYTFPAFKVPVY